MLLEFQYQKGAIKTDLPADSTIQDMANFNTKKVRLKQWDRVSTHLS